MKRINTLMLLLLVAAMGLFGGYLLWVHNNLDTTGPVITVEEGILEISVKDSDEALLRGVTAVDDRDGDVTATVLVESISGISREGLSEVIYAAFDSVGNVSKVARQIRYSDYSSPRFTLYGALCYPYGANFNILDRVGAIDVLEGDIRRRVHATLVSDTSSVSEMGTHLVRFQVMNQLGDTVVLELPVEVYDPLWFSASVELDEYLIYLEPGETFDPMAHLESFVVRGEEIDISDRIPEDIICEVSGQVNPRVPGVYEITYTLSMNLNLQTFSGQTKLIVVVLE